MTKVRWLGVLAFAGAFIASMGAASLAWACVAQPLISVQPMASGPPGTQVNIVAQDISGSAEIRWNGAEGPVLAKAEGSAFSAPVKIPQVPDGLYAIVLLDRGAGGAVFGSAATAFQVTGSGAAAPPPSTVGPTGKGALAPATKRGDVDVAAAGVIGLAVGALGATAAVHRRGRQQADGSTDRG